MAARPVDRMSGCDPEGEPRGGDDQLVQHFNIGKGASPSAFCFVAVEDLKAASIEWSRLIEFLRFSLET